MTNKNKEFISEHRYLIKDNYSSKELGIVAIRTIKTGDKLYKIPIPLYIFNIGMVLSLDKATNNVVDKELKGVYDNFIIEELKKLL